MTLIDKEALRDALFYGLRNTSEVFMDGSVRMAPRAKAAIEVLAAAEPVCCGRCARHDVTSFCSRWNRCSYPDDGCSYFTKREAT